MMLQTYIQIKDPFKSDEYGKSYYENFLNTIKFDAEESGKVREENYYPSSSCGTRVLSTIDGVGFKGVAGDKVNCGSYLKNLDVMSVKNSSSTGVFFISVFSRKFEDLDLQKLRRGDKLIMRGGYNIFNTSSDLDRVMYGFSDEFEIQLAQGDGSDIAS